MYIVGGWVTVDGQVVEEPQFMVSEQKVGLHPDATLIPIEPATILFHQPPATEMDAAAIPQLIRAETRTAEDPSGIRILRQHFVRLTRCLPLEANASGLAVFTQDYRISRKLTTDAATIEQEYVVEVAGGLADNGLKLLNHGLAFNGKPLPPAKVSWQNETRLRFALKGVRPGQIAHMCESVGLQILNLRRLRIGRVSMSGMPIGEWRYLMAHERF